MQMAEDEGSPFESLKILIRDLAPNTTQDELHHYFTQFGDITEAIIPHNIVTGSPHSFGFVVFTHPFRIPFILQLPHCIHDRCVEVSRALKGEDLQTMESQRMSSTGNNFQRPENFDKRRIFVQGSPYPGITNDEFLKYFQGFGSVIDCYFWNVIGFGHITFRMKRGADRVMYRRSYVLNGKHLKVNLLKRISPDHIDDAHNPNVNHATSISGGDHVNGTNDMQPRAATSDSETRNIQILPSTATSGTDHVDGDKDRQPQAAANVNTTTNMQIAPATESSGTDHVGGVKHMQPRDATSVSDTKNMQIAPAAASSGTDHVGGVKDMQSRAATSDSDTRNMQLVLPTETSGTDHIDGNKDRRPQAAARDSDTKNMQISPAAASSGTDHVSGVKVMQTRAARSSRFLG